MEYYHYLTFSFRFCNLNDDAFEVIEKTLSDIPFDVGKDYRESRKTISFTIEEEKDYSSVFKLLQTGIISEQDYGVFVSFTSEQEMTGIQFPEYVLKFYKQSGGQVDISIIIDSYNSE